MEYLLSGKKDILALFVRCSYASTGCQWMGNISSIKEHLHSCSFGLVPCTKGCKDEFNKPKKFSQADLKLHLERECPYRDYECIHCGEKSIVFADKELHFKKCKKILLPCPNDGCTKNIQRQGIKRHFDSCPQQEVPCKYMRLGCDAKIKRKDKQVHEEGEDKLHLHKALDAVAAMEERASTLWQDNSITFKVTDCKKKMLVKKMISSPTFYTPNGLHMTVDVYLGGHNGGENSHVSAYVTALSKYGEPVKSFGTVTLTLLNQLANEQHHTASGKEFPLFVPHASLELNKERNIQYLKDDAMFFRASVNAPNHKPWLECRARLNA